MADSNIGALSLAPNVADDSLLVMEQQGTAMKLTGAMLKEYARQGVELEFQDYLNEAQEAADSATGAVSAVTDMTVSAHADDTPTVTKSMQNGKVNLDFGLPRGEPGVPGGPGPRGPQGPPGNGLTILGHYDTEEELRAAVADPEPGEAYGVGAALPYDIYIFDGVSMDWRNYGPLSGDGVALPGNLVTCEGGATIVLEGDFGEAPHTITISNTGPPPLTAADVEYKDGDTVKDAIDELFTSGSEGKALIASAVTAKGVETAADATFQTMHDNILSIPSGSDTSDATATPGDILGGKTAYTASGKVEGIIPSLPAQTITPGTADKTIANGQYLAGTQIIKGDTNLVSSNIRKGVSIFGVPGAVESSFAATLTVKADIGAVVTATCGDTSVEALSTTGTVVMELPIEGTWKVTAVRGMAQYNTVTLEVSNQYHAELTATLHVQWLMTATPLSTARSGYPAAPVGNYAIIQGSSYCDTYDKNLIHDSGTVGISSYGDIGAASTENHAIFAGGGISNYPTYQQTAAIFTYDKSLTRGVVTYALSVARKSTAGASVGGYAVFGGGYGYTYDGSKENYTDYAVVDAFNAELVHTTPTQMAAAMRYPVAASNENYIIFTDSNAASAYNKSLTRSLAPGLSAARNIDPQMAAARAGNYILFAGGIYGSRNLLSAVEAYDLFLTRTTPEALSEPKYRLSGTTLNGFAVFGGGRTLTKSGNSTDYSGAVDVYDPYLVRTTPSSLTVRRENMSAVSIGNYALFAGGYQQQSRSDVEVYKYT